MQSGARIGSLFGIPLYIHTSWLVILVLFTFAKGLAWQEMYPEWGESLAYLTGFLSSILLFASVLLHELGHSLVARSQGIKVNSITLFLFGGIAAIDRESQTPGQAFQVAIAGPGVSFALFVLLSLGATFLPNASAPAGVLVQNLATINFVLCAFNLIPGLPLDGGQVLKAAVWKATGDRFKGVLWAAKAGTFLGTAAIAFGLFVTFTGSGSGGIWIALIGWFILQNANNYNRITNLQQVLVKTPITNAMTRQFRVVDARMTLREFTDRYLISDLYEGNRQHQVYFAASDGRYRGAVRTEDIRHIERSQWDTQTLESILKPFDRLVSVPESASLLDGILALEDSGRRTLTVLTPAGAVAGVLDRGDIVQTIARETGMTVPPSEVDRIKAEGNYPPSFPLAAIARKTPRDA